MEHKNQLRRTGGGLSLLRWKWKSIVKYSKNVGNLQMIQIGKHFIRKQQKNAIPEAIENAVVQHLSY